MGSYYAEKNPDFLSVYQCPHCFGQIDGLEDDAEPVAPQPSESWPRRNDYFDPPLTNGQMVQVQECINDALRAALDGAPEPDDVWEYGCDTGMGDEPRAHRSLALAESAASGVSSREYPDGRVEEFSRRVMRRRKAGPWLPVPGGDTP